MSGIEGRVHREIGYAVRQRIVVPYFIARRREECEPYLILRVRGFESFDYRACLLKFAQRRHVEPYYRTLQRCSLPCLTPSVDHQSCLGEERSDESQGSGVKEDGYVVEQMHGVVLFSNHSFSIAGQGLRSPSNSSSRRQSCLSAGTSSRT